MNAEKSEMGTMEGDNQLDELNHSDKGGRRKSNDRRQFTYTFHLPERRSGVDRRQFHNRRKTPRYSSNDG